MLPTRLIASRILFCALSRRAPIGFGRHDRLVPGRQSRQRARPDHNE